MEKQPKSALMKKRKRKTSTSITAASEPKTQKIETPNDDSVVKPTTVSEIKSNAPKQKKQVAKAKPEVETMEDAFKKYPLLQDQELVDKFLKVPFSNNQKGRIRQAINLQLKDSSNHLIPDVIHGKIQTILKSSKNLTDAELRRIRILYNMLKTSVQKMQNRSDSELGTEKPKAEKKKKDKKVKLKGNVEDAKESEGTEKREQLANKPRGPKRYVVFVGNLPLDIDREKLMEHFSEISDHIKDVRLPPPAEGKKSAIAFIEMSNEPSYEIALSKHHSMMGNKRINVLYTAQQNSKISKAEAKSKSAKLIALQKSGKLLGSVPLAKKRSHRRMKMKQARAKEAAASA